eukprot:365348-Chlamydomonas_euryale.AAC.2
MQQPALQMFCLTRRSCCVYCATGAAVQLAGHAGTFEGAGVRHRDQRHAGVDMISDPPPSVPQPAGMSGGNACTAMVCAPPWFVHARHPMVRACVRATRWSVHACAPPRGPCMRATPWSVHACHPMVRACGYPHGLRMRATPWSVHAGTPMVRACAHPHGLRMRAPLRSVHARHPMVRACAPPHGPCMCTTPTVRACAPPHGPCMRAPPWFVHACTPTVRACAPPLCSVHPHSLNGPPGAACCGVERKVAKLKLDWLAG